MKYWSQAARRSLGGRPSEFICEWRNVPREIWETPAQPGNLIEDAGGDIELAHFGQLFFAGRIIFTRVAEKKRDDICIRHETRAGLRDIVRDNKIRALLCQLFTRVFEQIICFGGETDDDSFAAIRG